MIEYEKQFLEFLHFSSFKLKIQYLKYIMHCLLLIIVVSCVAFFVFVTKLPVCRLLSKQYLNRNGNSEALERIEITRPWFIHHV